MYEYTCVQKYIIGEASYTVQYTTNSIPFLIFSISATCQYSCKQIVILFNDIILFQVAFNFCPRLPLPRVA